MISGAWPDPKIQSTLTSSRFSTANSVASDRQHEQRRPFGQHLAWSVRRLAGLLSPALLCGGR